MLCVFLSSKSLCLQERFTNSDVSVCSLMDCSFITGRDLLGQNVFVFFYSQCISQSQNPCASTLPSGPQTFPQHVQSAWNTQHCVHITGQKKKGWGVRVRTSEGVFFSIWQREQRNGNNKQQPCFTWQHGALPALLSVQSQTLTPLLCFIDTWCHRPPVLLTQQLLHYRCVDVETFGKQSNKKNWQLGNHQEKGN